MGRGGRGGAAAEEEEAGMLVSVMFAEITFLGMLLGRGGTTGARGL